jgi:integrase
VARVFKPTYLKPVPADSEIVTRDDKLHARFKRRGKTVVAPLTADGARVVLELRKWYVEYRDANGELKKVPGYTDKAATEQLAARLERQAARKEEGLCDPFEEHSKRPLREHLDDFGKELANRGNVPRYVETVVSRLRSLLDGCAFVFISDLSASRAAEWLAGLRRQAAPRAELPTDQAWFTRREVAALLGIKPASVSTAVRRHRLGCENNGKEGKARRFPRAVVEALQERLPGGAAVETTNQYLTHLKSFGSWLVKDRRTAANPFPHLEPGNPNIDRRHDRRELTADELRNVLTAARGSGRTFRGLTGEDRFHLYATACGTGFRASALGSLTPESFDLDGDAPTVTLAARHAKNRKTKVQPLPTDVADLLRHYLKGRPAGVVVWGGTWARDRCAATMLRIDLDAAGVPYVVAGPDGPLFADFHALRHTYLTLGGRAGIDLRTLQELAGHSTPVLTARYSHRRLYDLTGAVEKLPSFLPTKDGAEQQRQPLAATGTDGEGQEHVAQHVGHSDLPGPRLSFPGTEGERGPEKGETKKPLVSKGFGASGPLVASTVIRAGDRIRTGDVQLGKLTGAHSACLYGT